LPIRQRCPCMKFRDLTLFLIACVVLLGDQVSKAWVIENIPLNSTYALIPPLRDFFLLTHITNSGAAFGLFPQLSLVFTFVALIVSVVIVAYYRSIPTGQWLVRLSLGLQLGGAIGNLIDRLRFGAVTDLIYTGIFPLVQFPVFNLADLAIVTGVGLLMFHLWRTTPKAEVSDAVAQSVPIISERAQPDAMSSSPPEKPE
jgi:signal peptidase II